MSVLKHLPSSKPVSAETVAFYVLGLAPLSDEQLTAATAKAAQTCTFLPTPAELIALCGANRPVFVDTEKVLEQVRGLSDYHPSRGTTPPRVEQVRTVFGDAVGEAYGIAGGGVRLFSGNETTASIARREFDKALAEAITTHGPLPTPALQLRSGADEGAIVYDDQPRTGSGGFRRLGSGS